MPAAAAAVDDGMDDGRRQAAARSVGRAHDVAACASVYAHRLFECPWQYVPNSTLSDSLGCWRPSSGFN